MGSRITLVEDGLPVGLDGSLLFNSRACDWHGFPIEIRTMPCEMDSANRYNLNPLIFMTVTGSGRAQMVSGRHSYSVNVAPGTMHVFEAGFELDRGNWRGSPGVAVSLDLAHEEISRLSPEQPRLRSLNTEIVTTDGALAALVDAMRVEIEGGCPSGRLYAEGLSIALLGYLDTRFSSSSSAPVAKSRSSQRLTPASIRKVRDYIHQHLTADLSITELGKLLNLSAFHFARLFKASVGVSPHRFIVEQRIEQATLLLDSDLPLAEIAVTVGFSSQAHFTQVFRKMTGTTPARSRVS